MTTMKKNLGVALALLLLFAFGCNGSGNSTSRTDAQVASDIYNKINSDTNVPDKQITVASNQGTVTLSGTVSNEGVRTAAANDAAQIDGVKKVINNLEVGTPMAANNQPQMDNSAANNQLAASQPEPQPAPRATTTNTRKSSPSRKFASRPDDDNGLRTTVPQDNGNNNAANSQNNNQNGSAANITPSLPPTPPPPVKVTVPAGTQLSIRVNEEVNSEKAQVGDVFHGSLAAPISIDDQTIIPTTADVEGRVVEVKSAGRFAGQSVLTLQLTKLVMNGKSYAIQTDQWSKSGNGRGKSTAEKVGGGAAVGAVLGGIFGGGKGAAIGAAAGAGAGTGVSAATKGQQIVLKPEAVVAFQLSSPLTVTPSTGNRQPMQNP